MDIVSKCRTGSDGASQLNPAWSLSEAGHFSGRRRLRRLDDPTSFEPVPPGGPTACVWELAVHAHERDAFVVHVLNPPDGPDYDAYLADTLTVTSTGTGELIERFNHDLWTIEDGRIAVKDAYRKSFPDRYAVLIDQEHLDWADIILDRQGIDR
ncbi:hypothetical protein [Candidatus Poriferisodalis sp.]|uniref:hypothetical protein n=1 Tax=Candidatus Poriferisodalis sp. TaxID=3101277 RepID=UPI003B5929CD